jgi:hypothetical protein
VTARSLADEGQAVAIGDGRPSNVALIMQRRSLDRHLRTDPDRSGLAAISRGTAMTIHQPTDSPHPRRMAYEPADRPDCPHIQASGGGELDRECDRQSLGYDDFAAAATTSAQDHHTRSAVVGVDGHSRDAELASSKRPGRGSAEDIGPL